MCGRFTNKMGWRELHDLYRLADGYQKKDGEWQGKVNIAPTTQIPVIYSPGGERTFSLMRWGLVPAWSKEIGKFSTFNARSDGIDSKPSYRGAWKAGRRCIIPADSFFEWRKNDKQPFAIGLGNKGPMNFAGLWEEWNPKDAEPMLSCTMITTDANKTIAEVHNRMPVIIGDEDLPAWLGEENTAPGQLEKLLMPFPGSRVKLWPVPKAVGNIRNQGDELLDETVI
jgi:putative SOS response-associated peptidase YedK